MFVFNATFARLPKASAKKKKKWELTFNCTGCYYVFYYRQSRCCAVPRVLWLTILQSWNYLNNHTFKPSFYQNHQSTFCNSKLKTTAHMGKWASHSRSWESALLRFGKLNKFWSGYVKVFCRLLYLQYLPAENRHRLATAAAKLSLTVKQTFWLTELLADLRLVSDKDMCHGKYNSPPCASSFQLHYSVWIMVQ